MSSALCVPSTAVFAPLRTRAPRTTARAQPVSCATRKTPVASVRPARKAEVASLADQTNAQWWLAGAAFTTFLAPAEEAMAAGGDLGILEGRTLALIHPIVMFGLFGATGYAGYLGWQHRRTRTIGEEISALKKALPVPAEGAAPSSTKEIDALVATRKELVAGGFRDRHWNVGNVLLSLGVFMGVAGPLNTFARTGKLFPGPHLYAGAAIVVLWAFAAALVPYMQKGDNNARNAHIALNSINLGLFAWQLPTGWAIVEKVFQFTSWP